jgi:hypothetical protein
MVPPTAITGNFRNSLARQHRVGADRHGEPAHAQIRVALANDAAACSPTGRII